MVNSARAVIKSIYGYILMVLKFFIGFLLLLLLNVSLHAQNQVRPIRYGYWLVYMGENRVSKRWAVHSEVQLRNYLLDNTLQQTLFRPGVIFLLNDDIRFTAGYVMLYTRPGPTYVDGEKLLENRVWQQAMMRHENGRLHFEHRYRSEQRFIKNLNKDTESVDHRIRYRFLMNIPLGFFTPGKERFFLIMNDEVFINLSKSRSGSYLDRNRLVIATGYHLKEDMNLQLAYLNQIVIIPGRGNPDVTHNLQVSLIYNPDLRKNTQAP